MKYAMDILTDVNLANADPVNDPFNHGIDLS